MQLLNCKFPQIIQQNITRYTNDICSDELKIIGENPSNICDISCCVFICSSSFKSEIFATKDVNYILLQKLLRNVIDNQITPKMTIKSLLIEDLKRNTLKKYLPARFELVWITF